METKRIKAMKGGGVKLFSQHTWDIAHPETQGWVRVGVVSDAILVDSEEIPIVEVVIENTDDVKKTPEDIEKDVKALYGITSDKTGVELLDEIKKLNLYNPFVTDVVEDIEKTEVEVVAEIDDNIEKTEIEVVPIPEGSDDDLYPTDDEIREFIKEKTGKPPHHMAKTKRLRELYDENK